MIRLLEQYLQKKALNDLVHKIIEGANLKTIQRLTAKIKKPLSDCPPTMVHDQLCTSWIGLAIGYHASREVLEHLHQKEGVAGFINFKSTANPDVEPLTLLWYACALENTEGLKFLLENQALKYEPDQGWNALIRAICSKKNPMELVDLIFSHGFNKEGLQKTMPVSPLRVAAIEGRIDVADCLIKKHQIDINEVCSDGNTALTVAAINNQQEMVFYLLENGADPQVKCQETGLLWYQTSEMAGGFKQDKYFAWKAKQEMQSLEERLTTSIQPTVSNIRL